MELYLDTADLKAIEELWPLLPFDGVTTNPNIVAKGGRPLEELLPAIRAIVGPEATLFAQVVARETGAMVDEALALRELDRKLVVKVPALPAGYAAIKALRERGISTLGTAVFTPMQGLLAAKAGPAYPAPYVNSVESGGGDGIQLVRELQGLFDLHRPSCWILAASFRTPRQLLACFLAGAKAATISPETARLVMGSDQAEAVIGRFEGEWRKAFGDRPAAAR